MLNLPGLVTVYSTGVPWGDTTASGPYVQGLASAAAIMAGFANGASYNSLHAQLGSAFKVPTFNNQVGTFHTPYYEQWSLQVQQAFGDKSVMTLGYVGNHGVYIPIYNQGLNAFMNPNISGYNVPPFPSTPPTGCGNASCSQSAIFANVQQYRSGAVSNYNGLTASFSQRMTHGLTVQASYTWSHAMDDVSNSGVGATPYNGNTIAGLPDQPGLSALQQLRQRRLRHPPLLQRQLRLASALQVQQQLCQRRFRRMDDLAELLPPLRSAADCAGRQLVHLQLDAQLGQ